MLELLGYLLIMRLGQLDWLSHHIFSTSPAVRVSFYAESFKELPKLRQMMSAVINAHQQFNLNTDLMYHKWYNLAMGQNSENEHLWGIFKPLRKTKLLVHVNEIYI